MCDFIQEWLLCDHGIRPIGRESQSRPATRHVVYIDSDLPAPLPPGNVWLSYRGSMLAHRQTVAPCLLRRHTDTATHGGKREAGESKEAPPSKRPRPSAPASSLDSQEMKDDSSLSATSGGHHLLRFMLDGNRETAIEIPMSTKEKAQTEFVRLQLTWAKTGVGMSRLRTPATKTASAQFDLDIDLRPVVDLFFRYAHNALALLPGIPSFWQQLRGSELTLERGRRDAESKTLWLRLPALLAAIFRANYAVLLDHMRTSWVDFILVLALHGYLVVMSPSLRPTIGQAWLDRLVPQYISEFKRPQFATLPTIFPLLTATMTDIVLGWIHDGPLRERQAVPEQEERPTFCVLGTLPHCQIQNNTELMALLILAPGLTRQDTPHAERTEESIWTHAAIRQWVLPGHMATSQGYVMTLEEKDQPATLGDWLVGIASADASTAGHLLQIDRLLWHLRFVGRYTSQKHPLRPHLRRQLVSWWQRFPSAITPPDFSTHGAERLAEVRRIMEVAVAHPHVLGQDAAGVTPLDAIRAWRDGIESAVWKLMRLGPRISGDAYDDLRGRFSSTSAVRNDTSYFVDFKIVDGRYPYPSSDTHYFPNFAHPMHINQYTWVLKRVVSWAIALLSTAAPLSVVDKASLTRLDLRMSRHYAREASERKLPVVHRPYAVLDSATLLSAMYRLIHVLLRTPGPEAGQVTLPTRWRDIRFARVPKPPRPHSFPWRALATDVIIWMNVLLTLKVQPSHPPTLLTMHRTTVQTQILNLDVGGTEIERVQLAWASYTEFFGLGLTYTMQDVMRGRPPWVSNIWLGQLRPAQIPGVLFPDNLVSADPIPSFSLHGMQGRNRPWDLVVQKSLGWLLYSRHLETGIPLSAFARVIDFLLRVLTGTLQTFYRPPGTPLAGIKLLREARVSFIKDVVLAAIIVDPGQMWEEKNLPFYREADGHLALKVGLTGQLGPPNIDRIWRKLTELAAQNPTAMVRRPTSTGN